MWLEELGPVVLSERLKKRLKGLKELRIVPERGRIYGKKATDTHKEVKISIVYVPAGVAFRDEVLIFLEEEKEEWLPRIIRRLRYATTPEEEQILLSWIFAPCPKLKTISSRLNKSPSAIAYWMQEALRRLSEVSDEEIENNAGSISIMRLNLPSRVANALWRQNVRTLNALIQLPLEALFNIPEFGKHKVETLIQRFPKSRFAQEWVTLQQIQNVAAKYEDEFREWWEKIPPDVRSELARRIRRILKVLAQ